MGVATRRRKILMALDPTLLGSVQDVQGATVRVALDDGTVSGLTFVEGRSYRIGQVGSFVRVPLGYIDLFGVVAKVGAGAVPEAMREVNPYGNRWLGVELVGQATRGGHFERGVSQYPTIDDPVHLVAEQDLARIYGRADASKLLRIGHLASAESIPALLDLNQLVTRHSAVVGSTGAGKSTTVAGLLTALSEPGRYPSARAMIIDIHGEYPRALKERATVFRINPDADRGETALYVPYWALTFDEFLSLTLGDLEESGRGAVIQKITELKKESLEAKARPGVATETLTVDSPVPFSIHKLWFELHCEIHATHHETKGVPQSRETWALLLNKTGEPQEVGDALAVKPPGFCAPKDVKEDPEKIRLSRSSLNIARPLAALAARLRDPRFDFLFRPGDWLPKPDQPPTSDLDTLLQGWVGGAAPVTILDLSGVPPSILNDLLGALLRIIYDALFWARNLPEGGRERPLLLVLEEAHSYLSRSDSSPAAAAVRRIVKEGRKYGIGAMIVSQRPSEIDQTILSQCGTIFAMRLANSTDRGHVTGAASDNLEGLFAMLPTLRTGEAIVVGEAVNLPMRALVDAPPPDRRPDSGDPKVVTHEVPGEGFDGPGGWNQRRDPEDYAEVLELWRRQSPRPKHLQ